MPVYSITIRNFLKLKSTYNIKVQAIFKPARNANTSSSSSIVHHSCQSDSSYKQLLAFTTHLYLFWPLSRPNPIKLIIRERIGFMDLVLYSFRRVASYLVIKITVTVLRGRNTSNVNYTIKQRLFIKIYRFILFGFSVQSKLLFLILIHGCSY